MRHVTSLWSITDRYPVATDGAIAAILCGLAVLSVHVHYGASGQPTATTVGLTVLLLLPLTWRRRWPLAVLAVMTPVLILLQVMDKPGSPWLVNGWWVALYSAGAFGRPVWRTVIRGMAIVSITGLVIYELVVSDPPGFTGDRSLLVALELLSNAVFFAAVWWLGDTVRIRREHELELAARTRELEREREENARRAVLQERVRIARELHDVVAHHVSVMGIQAAAARRVLQRRPEQAEAALETVEAASRQALHEMHRLLGLLRQEHDDRGLAPQPGVGQLGELLSQVREAGLPVELSVEGPVRPLPASVDLSAYRIVQEALTNTLKHAGPARARVTLRYRPSAVELEVVDDGRGAGPSRAAGSGNGLIGMRERVSVLGGCLHVSHHPGVGFSVRASLPLDGGSP